MDGAAAPTASPSALLVKLSSTSTPRNRVNLGGGTAAVAATASERGSLFYCQVWQQGPEAHAGCPVSEHEPGCSHLVLLWLLLPQVGAPKLS